MSNSVISQADIVEAAGRIEPLPAAVARLVSVMSDPDYSAGSVVEIVNHDPVLAGDVLARANSAASASSTRIGDLRQATARIGVSAVVEIAVRRAMHNRLSGSIAAYGMGPNELWHHAVTASVAAEIIRRKATAPIAPMLSTAALVHDIGKVVIAACLPTGMTDVLMTAADTDGIDIVEAERRVIGIDHGEVGGVVVRTWGLPVSVQVALTQHHTDDPDADVFTRCLILADRVAHAVRDLPSAGDEDAEVDGEADLTPLVPDVDHHAEACGIPVSSLPEIVIDTAEQTADVLSVYG